MTRYGAGLLALVAMGCHGKDKDQGSDGTGSSVTPIDYGQITTTDRPDKRSEIQSTGNEATNSILLFGGNTGPVVNQTVASDFLNDTWIFEPGTGWTEVASADSPHKRGRYALVNDEAGHRALLFGGRYRETAASGDYVLYNDLWQFDFDGRTWSKLDDGTGPSPRYYGNGAFDPTTGVFYLMGGATNANPLSITPVLDLWAWDGASWSQLTTTGDAPSSRTYMATTYDSSRNELIAFAGGKGDFQSCSYNDLYALNLDTLKWKQLDDGQKKAPATRFNAMIQYDAASDRYLAFGGHADVGSENDLWAFDPNGGKWEQIRKADVLVESPYSCTNVVSPGCAGNNAEVPKEFADEDLTAPEPRYGGMFVLMHDNLWTGFGINTECSDHLDDIWRYDLAADWSQLLEARSGLSCARRGDDCECMCI